MEFVLAIRIRTTYFALSHRNTNFTIEGGRALFVWWTVLFLTNRHYFIEEKVSIHE